MGNAGLMEFFFETWRMSHNATLTLSALLLLGLATRAGSRGLIQRELQFANVNSL